MTPIEPKSNSTVASTGNSDSAINYDDIPKDRVRRSNKALPNIPKRKPVHQVKGASAKEIRESLKISKRDILIARRVVNRMRHK